MIDNLFGLVALLVLPFWLAMLLFPGTPLTRRLVTSPWPFIALGGLQALFLVGALVSLSPAGLGLSAGSFRESITGDWGLVATWSHLLVLDLFAGIWIFRDTGYWKMRPAPFLIATLLAGPVGLGIYLYVRSRREFGDPVRNLN
jgi:hypothetical protein